MVNGDRKEGICRLNVDGNGCEYLHILSDLETKLRNNTNPKEKIELALQGALMFYGADRAYVIEVDDELGISLCFIEKRTTFAYRNYPWICCPSICMSRKSITIS